MYLAKTDVLIIGGGAAGCFAAIKAKDQAPDLDITIVEKAHIRRSGSLTTGMDSLNVVCLPEECPPRSYVECINRTALNGIIDQDLQYILAERSYSIVKDLEDWGVEFAKVDGKYDMKARKGIGNIFLPIVNSQELKVTLAAQVVKRNVNIINHSMVTSLLSNPQRVFGATVLNTRNGSFSVIRAKAVILTTGSCGRFGLPSSGYLFGTFDFPGNAGDGYSMAYHVGAELTNMEYCHYFLGIKDVYAPPAKFHQAFPGLSIIPEKARIRRVNSKGVNVTKHTKERGYSEYWEINPEYWDSLNFFKGEEPWFLDATQLSKSMIKAFEKTMFRSERRFAIKQFFEERGLKLDVDLIELGRVPSQICGGHGISGVVIDKDAKTTVEGLYAAGDVAAVGRQMLVGAFVFGSIAGIVAAKNAGKGSHTEINEEEVDQYRERLFEPLWRKEGLTPANFEVKLRRKIREYIDPPRNKKKLMIALRWIERLRKEDLPCLAVRDFHELGRAIEGEFILDCAEMVARASLTRKESRWGIFDYRSDFPNRDDENWLKKIIVKKCLETNDMRILVRPVSTNKSK
jgi:succinate dehydrogenase/fumarate reductase flavoprotein subunit